MNEEKKRSKIRKETGKDKNGKKQALEKRKKRQNQKNNIRKIERNCDFPDQRLQLNQQQQKTGKRKNEKKVSKSFLSHSY